MQVPFFWVAKYFALHGSVLSLQHLSHIHTSMITASSCQVKVQQFISLEEKVQPCASTHMAFLSIHSFIFSFPLAVQFLHLFLIFISSVTAVPSEQKQCMSLGVYEWAALDYYVHAIILSKHWLSNYRAFLQKQFRELHKQSLMVVNLQITFTSS